jgi:macrodomain Ter protein organizer (MatP/YcbG family)
MTMNDGKMTITVEGYEATQVKEWLSERINREVTEQLDRTIEGQITDAVRERLDKLVEDLTMERVSKEIDAILEEGWTLTNQYGEPTGRKLTLRDRVRSYFDSKADSYDRMSRVEKWIHEGVTSALKGALDEEIKSARERLRKSFDEVLQAKFTATIRDALGLK